MTQLLEILPKELKFIVEVKKQSSCSIQLTNNTYHNVAFKVKTTSPKKYSVRPNVGIVDPKSTFEFIVTMQAQKVAPDMVCRDKFLIQSTTVPVGTTEKDITPSMFAKDNGKHVEEVKMRVALISPPESPVLSPINGVLKQGPFFEPSVLKDPVENRVEILAPPQTELKLASDIEEVKSKLHVLESKLNEAEATISKLTEEKRRGNQEHKILREQLDVLRSRTSVKRVHTGFPLLFVAMTALISIMVGYLLHL
uniref:MSP domain-containing protein n=1 Tax=Salix viminalis TaxID=40686 RepID=A0A6N2LXB6_SALVM